MKKLLSLAALGACLAFGTAAHAQDKAPTAQQNKMKTCNAEAGDKKGDERKAFMKQCLSAAKQTQQDRMKSCNADPKAKALKGDERKAFMKECLSNKAA
ncbi:PsiF family protein [Xenophilus azovorans]|uniref:PsiF family protein n=1 Tax=Xenophilus TaxID=151754 RepID=UPI00056F8FAD|nr:PsiF family protein [Xenophilus azovorans]